MEDIRELIILGGGVLIAAILLHGLWLAWRRRNALRLRIEPNLVPDDLDDDWLNGDFPNGGARVRADASLPAEPTEEGPWGGVDEEAPPHPAWQAEAAEQQESDPLFAPQPISVRSWPRQAQGQPASNAAASHSATVTRVETPPSDMGEAHGGEPAAAAPLDGDRLMMVHVLAPRGERFDGEELLRVLRAENLKYGRMGIFHRADPQTQKCRFSVAKAVKPGYFDLGEDCSSPGVTAFMQLAGSLNQAAALDDMLRTAQSIAKTLGGAVLDANRRPLTSQTLSEYYNRVAGFPPREMAG